MATKSQILTDPDGCLCKAADDEPIFILRANDPIAGQVVRIWASLARGHHATEKQGQAWRESFEMEAWRRRKYGDPK